MVDHMMQNSTKQNSSTNEKNTGQREKYGSMKNMVQRQKYGPLTKIRMNEKIIQCKEKLAWEREITNENNSY